MDEYTKLLNRLNMYFELKDVETYDDIISAYDLCEILSNKFSLLREIKCGEDLQKKINSQFTPNKKLRLLFKNKKDVLDYEVGFICVVFENNVSRISIIFKSDNNDIPKNLYIYKDIGSEDIYHESIWFEDVKPFIDKYHDKLMYYFKVIENYGELLGTNNNHKIEQKFSDDFLVVNISYDDFGRVNSKITLDYQADPNHIFDREYHERKKLSGFVTENKELLLKKIPINISELDDVCKKIISEKLEKNKVYKLAK